MRTIESPRTRHHGAALMLVIAFAMAITLNPGSNRGASATLLIAHFQAGNGGKPFAGDRTNFITISPNGDGFRDAARMSFQLTRAARVTLTALVDGGRAAPPKLISSTSENLGAGTHRLSWTPDPNLEPRTYMLRVSVDGLTAAALVVRVLGVDAGFTKQSYHQRDVAALIVSSDASKLTVRLFQAGPEEGPSLYGGYGNNALYGIPVGGAMEINWSRNKSRRATLHLRVPSRASGLYFARIDTDDGRFGFAPFVLLPHPFGGHRVAVVFPTNTWEAYNHRDVDGNGSGDTWYSVNSIPRVDLTRPYLHKGVPTRFRGYELGFLRWLYRSDKNVDFITDRQLDQLSAHRLHALYDLVVFLGHHEYMTTHSYDVTIRYRDLGGNLMFTSTTNFLYRAARHGRWLFRQQPWRELGRPEAGLIGVQYLRNDGGKHQGHYVVVGANAAPWAFRGTGLHNGSSFGHGGIEIDARSSASPPGTIVLARMPNLQGPGYSPEMTYYSTRAGAKVFAAGTLNFAGTALEPTVRPLLENVWKQLARP
jgi:hypothetical protein